MPSLMKPPTRLPRGLPLLGIKDLVDKTASPKNRLVPLEIEWGRRLLRQWEFIYRLYRRSTASLTGSTASLLFRASQRLARVHSDYRLESVSAWNGRYYTMTLSKVKRSWVWHINEMFAGEPG